MKERKISKLFEKIGIMLFTVILVYLSFLIVNKVYIKHYEKSLKDYEWVVNHTELVKNQDFGLNVYMVEKNRKISIYNKHYRKAIDENIERLKEEAYYTLEEPLLMFNPYGTNNVGLNIYFETEKESKVEYTIRVKSTSKIPEYSNTLYNKDEYTKIHEYQIIGLVAENINELELRIIDKEGNAEKRKFVFDLTEVRYLSQIKLETTKGNETEEELTNGLYTILGNDSNKLDYVAMYDNNGILRMEIPIIGYRAHKILFENDKIYFSISQTKIVEMDRLGKITEIYNTGKYQLHHDYVFDHEGNMLVLANNTEKDTEEDCIIKINLKTKEVTEVIDFEGMFFDYVKKCTLDENAIRDEGEDGLDWLHLNSLVYIDGDVLLSSRETSSIIRVNDIYKEQKLEYILSDKYLWEETKFEDFVYEKEGDFLIHAGQHALTYEKTDDEKIYYIHFYNNNYGKANSRPDIDYKKIGIENTKTPFVGDASYYYVYKVNEYNKTFEKVKEIKLPYSGIVSNIQLLGDNIITDSGTAGIFAEYDKDGALIKKFKINLNNYFVYRVIKYDFTQFYF